jgi:hypothetical protein
MFCICKLAVFGSKQILWKYFKNNFIGQEIGSCLLYTISLIKIEDIDAKQGPSYICFTLGGGVAQWTSDKSQEQNTLVPILRQGICEGFWRTWQS